MGYEVLMIKKRFAKVYIEITNVCNLSCAFCAGTNRKKEFMSLDLFKTALEKVAPYTDYVYLHVLGEPLLHPQIAEFFDEAEKNGLRVVLVTNGTKLCESGNTLLSKKALHKVNISLHALEANPCIEENTYLESCLDFADKASKKGVVSVLRLWNGGVKNELNEKIEEKIQSFFKTEWKENSRGFRIRDKLFLEYADRFEWTESESCEKARCYALKDQFAILCDGSVVPCCIDCEGTLKMGNIKTDSLEEMLSGELASSIRSGFDKGQAVFDTCKKCGFVRKRL